MRKTASGFSAASEKGPERPAAHEPAGDEAQQPSPHCRTAVIIPCYRVGTRVLPVIAGIGPEVDAIYVVDDACPEQTGRLVSEATSDPRVRVLQHASNQGVGGATLTGMRAAFDDGGEILVKLDGDGQVDPGLIARLIAPIVCGEADGAKGNRFYDLDGLRAMPWIRLLGNGLLSFLTKASSGYWGLFDPTNGFVAIHRVAFGRLPLAKLARGYFFESDLLFRLYTIRARIVDVPMAASYGDEVSSLRIGRVIGPFFVGHLRNLLKRLAYAYFLRDFTIASVYLILGSSLTVGGLAFGIAHWLRSVDERVFASAGTVMLAALPLIVGFQMLIGFLTIDSNNAPTVPLQRRWRGE